MTNHGVSPDDVAAAVQDEQNASLTETSHLVATLPMHSLAKRDLAMLNLVVRGTSTGLGGRTILELARDLSIGGEWEICFKVGDIVKVDKQPSASGKKTKDMDSTGFNAVVTRTGRDFLMVAAEEDINLIPEGRLWLVKLVNEAVFKRMLWACSKIKEEGIEGRPAVRLALGNGEPQVGRDESVKLLNDQLNPPQLDAVKYALGSDLSIIFGPPGTGKTATVVETVRQLVQRGERVLLCAPSNVAVDNLVERLSHYYRRRTDVLRLGHPARVADAVLGRSIDIVTKQSNDGLVLRELQDEIMQTLSKAQRGRFGERKEAWGLLKDLRRDYRKRESSLLTNLFLGARVVACTLHTGGSKEVSSAIRDYPDMFNTLVIDEISQALLPQVWIPLVAHSGIKRLIIAGDNKQLPPTVTSKDDKVQHLLQKTLFDILVDSYGEKVQHLISIQYRMCKDIMQFPSHTMYGGKLVAHESVSDQALIDLPKVEKTPATESRVLWIDTLDNCPETKEEEGFSIWNDGEVQLVLEFTKKLMDAGVSAEDIGVISPYAAQVSLIRQSVVPLIEVATVDGFQGREKEVIILSLVRSNEKGEIGFVADERRINVAITRPRRQLCIVGNSEIIGTSGFLRKWVEWCQENADIEYAEL